MLSALLLLLFKRIINKDPVQLMNSFAVGVDVPVSQMPAGMAFDGSSGGGGGYGLGNFGSDFLGGLGKGIMGALGGGSSSGGSSGSYGGSRTPYTDQTKDLLGVLIRQAIDSFGPAESTLS